jgi:hypothetical protein
MTQQSDPSDVSEQIGTDPQVDVTEDASGKESYHGYSVDDESQPQSPGDSLVDPGGVVRPGGHVAHLLAEPDDDEPPSKLVTKTPLEHAERGARRVRPRAGGVGVERGPDHGRAPIVTREGSVPVASGQPR